MVSSIPPLTVAVPSLTMVCDQQVPNEKERRSPPSTVSTAPTLLSMPFACVELPLPSILPAAFQTSVPLLVMSGSGPSADVDLYSLPVPTESTILSLPLFTTLPVTSQPLRSTVTSLPSGTVKPVVSRSTVTVSPASAAAIA